MGRTPDEIAQFIVDDVGEAVRTGSVIVLVGLSGTGKGTTVSALASKLPNCVTWSNGNVFRAFTLLACTLSKSKSGEESEFDPSILTSENIASFVEMLSFDYFEEDDRGFDIKISGLGLDYFVNDIKNTELKAQQIGRNIPTVAEVTQGEAIMFAKNALNVMRERGMNVLLEGREQTVDFIESEFRYCLKLSDSNVIGMRRVAQIVGANGLRKIEAGEEENVEEALNKSLEEF